LEIDLLAIKGDMIIEKKLKISPGLKNNPKAYGGGYEGTY
jgi:hypothetical protein